MRVLAVIEINDDDVVDAYGFTEKPAAANPWGREFDDLCASLDARFTNFYLGANDDEVRGKLVACAVVDGILPDILAAAEVGADGAGDPDSVLGTLATLRGFDIEEAERAEG